MSELGLGEATIVSLHDAEEISVAGGGSGGSGVIHVVPAWAWMLGV
jgi:hypothetical protein